MRLFPHAVRVINLFLDVLFVFWRQTVATLRGLGLLYYIVLLLVSYLFLLCLICNAHVTPAGHLLSRPCCVTSLLAYGLECATV